MRLKGLKKLSGCTPREPASTGLRVGAAHEANSVWSFGEQTKQGAARA